MNIDDARIVCGQWFDYLRRQREKSIELQHLASLARTGPEGAAEAKRRMGQIDKQPHVFDGARLEPAVRALLDELEHFKSSGIVEIAVRNSRVAEYMSHWEGRATKAEAELAALRAERYSLLGKITDHNNALQAQCGVGDQEAVACGYRPYFEHSGRRCPNCPTDNMIPMEGPALPQPGDGGAP